MSPRQPTPEQREAADPARSVWVTANAGSGKTGVLTDRVARLLLGGVAPERILCLTYTKAAAAEMQERLFRLLGGWAMAEDDALGTALAAVTGAPAPGPAALADARRLFARALETPGGLKIQTIHAFCDGLLRRFPLEAGLSPRFRELDDRERARMLIDALAGMAAEAEAGRDHAFDGAASRITDGGLGGLIEAILAKRRAFEGTAAPGTLDNRLGALLGGEALDQAASARAAFLGLGGFGGLLALLDAKGGAQEKKIATALRAAEAATDPSVAVRAVLAAVLTAEGKPRKTGFPTKDVAKAGGADDAARLTEWAVAARAALNAADSAARARDLDRFARALLARYGAAKAEAGVLDFHDMIERARALLTEREMAAWVLWKLDHGIEHILVDEAQDTSPEQWQVIGALTEEFFAAAPEGAPRTLFVVGDEKQSIYSFQGADPRAFEKMRGDLGHRLSGKAGLAEPRLEVSFRSAPGILRFVDALFEGVSGVALSGGPIRHTAHREGHGALVELWAPVEPEEPEDPPGWETAEPATPVTEPRIRLADILAGEIARMTREDRLPQREGAPGAPISPGDILVLVRRRDALTRRLIHALKARSVPVTGADRMTLGQEVAAEDLIALLHVLAMPSDDLRLAAVLRSPLGGLREEALFALAHGRAGTLWQAVMAAGGPVAAMLRDLAGRADFLRPYELLERVLIGHGGRARLLARLGAEAEDAIDELLAQALAYERTEPPTLPGFLAWLEAGDIEVKREMDQSAGAVRVMTVHGAKGLEAPVVVLPDTMSKPGQGNQGPRLVPAGPEKPGDAPILWLAGKTEDCDTADAARAEADRRAEEEYRRLLYVAATRAEDRLLICGAGKTDAKATEGTWYALARDAMDRLEATEGTGPTGACWRLGDLPEPQEPGANPADAALAAVADANAGAPPPCAPPLPDWAGPAAHEPRRRPPSPSTLLDAEPASGSGGADPHAARLHGLAVHLVLERLGQAPEEDRAALGECLLAAHRPGLDATARAAALAEADSVLAAPFAGEVFGPGALAEAGLAIRLPRLAGTAMIGRADRVIVTPDRVDVIDIKTDRAPPGDPADAPPAYLAQLGAYAHGLAEIFPGREVRAQILWTALPALMTLPQPLLDAALARASAVDAPA